MCVFALEELQRPQVWRINKPLKQHILLSIIFRLIIKWIFKNQQQPAQLSYSLSNLLFFFSFLYLVLKVVLLKCH